MEVRLTDVITYEMDIEEPNREYCFRTVVIGLLVQYHTLNDLVEIAQKDVPENPGVIGPKEDKENTVRKGDLGYRAIAISSDTLSGCCSKIAPLHRSHRTEDWPPRIS